MTFPLPSADPVDLGLSPAAIDRLTGLIGRHIADGRYPGAQVAIARHGKLAFNATFGDARLEPSPAPAGDDTLWLLYSNTKVITAAAIWILVEQGALGYTDRIADHVPGFEKNGKGEITLFQLLTHQAGFPEANIPMAAWEDHGLLREVVCKFSLHWEPGSRIAYHALSAHWAAAVLIEAITGEDFRDFIRRAVIEPLGLGNEMFVGLPAERHDRAVDMHEPAEDGSSQVRMELNNTAGFRAAGMPGGGGYATARAMAALYQMMLAGGTLNGTRLVSPRTIAYVTRNHTGDRVDEVMGMPMHRGIGPHVRGFTPNIRGLGALASPTTYGHGGVGSSYCWADPDSGVSFAYITNSKQPEPWHSQRMDAVSNCVHAAIDAVD